MRIYGTMNLVIVESAAKAKTIEKHLKSIFKDDGTFKVIASFGHVRDLPSKEMGVNTEDWTIKYESMEKKREVISRMRTAIGEASMVYLAADPDREGEAIAFHLQSMFNIPKHKYKRVTFHEITKDAIETAFKHPRDIDFALVDAQETRRVLDRIVGYELSPLLWRRYCTSSLSAGRVQSTALHMIVQRAKEASEHNAELFWTIEGSFGVGVLVANASFYYENEEAKWERVEEAKAMFDWIILKKDTKGWKLQTEHKKSKKNPSAPFITTTLQNEAYTRYGFNAKRTMQLAQALYEAGYITYMRTDSPTLSHTAQQEVLAHIGKELGDNMGHARSYTSKQAHSQEAHECIRPSKVYVRGSDISGDTFTQSHRQLYDLIWRRTVASQMVSAEYVDVSFCIEHVKMPKYSFRGTVHLLAFKGFLDVWSPSVKEDQELIDAWRCMSKDSIRMEGCICKGDATRGVSLYNEPSLIKSLEREGIGRPSTYATIIDKLFDKKYVIHGTNPQKDVTVKKFTWMRKDDAVTEEDLVIHLGGTDKDKYVPTSLGEKVIDYIHEVYPKLLDIKFTSDMEKSLDDISSGSVSKNHVLTSFYKDFHPVITHHSSIIKEKGETKEKQEKGPKTALKEFSNLSCAIVQTKYGPALYEKTNKRFVSITPYLEWKGKTYSEMEEHEVRFLLSLPCKVTGSTRVVMMGPYGLYVKDGTKNIPLPREQWNHVIDGTITSDTLNGLTTPAKKTWPKKSTK